MRVAFVVYVDLDPIPGSMHSKESAQNVLEQSLQFAVGQYNPRVSLAPRELQPEHEWVKEEHPTEPLECEFKTAACFGEVSTYEFPLSTGSPKSVACEQHAYIRGFIAWPPARNS